MCFYASCLRKCHNYLCPDKVWDIDYVWDSVGHFRLCTKYTSYRFGDFPTLPHELFLSSSVKQWKSVVHWCARLIQPVLSSLANILITLNQPVQTSIDGLVPIVVSLTKYYAFKNKCHQKCSAFRSSWLIGWENIWVTKPSLLRHRKVLLQCYAGEKDNKCKQLIVAFKVLRNKTSLSVLQLCFLSGSLGGNFLSFQIRYDGQTWIREKINQQCHQNKQRNNKKKTVYCVRIFFLLKRGFLFWMSYFCYRCMPL